MTLYSSIYKNVFYKTPPQPKWAFIVDFTQYGSNLIDNYQKQLLSNACINCSIGKRSVNAIPVYYAGLSYNMQGRYTNNGQLELTFNDNKYLTITNILDQLYTESFNDNFLEKENESYRQIYNRNNTILLYIYEPNDIRPDNDLVPTKVYEYGNCWISNINNEELSYESDEEVLKRTITIEYGYFKEMEYDDFVSTDKSSVCISDESNSNDDSISTQQLEQQSDAQTKNAESNSNNEIELDNVTIIAQEQKNEAKIKNSENHEETPNATRSPVLNGSNGESGASDADAAYRAKLAEMQSDAQGKNTEQYTQKKFAGGTELANAVLNGKFAKGDDRGWAAVARENGYSKEDINATRKIINQKYAAKAKTAEAKALEEPKTSYDEGIMLDTNIIQDKTKVASDIMYQQPKKEVIISTLNNNQTTPYEPAKIVDGKVTISSKPTDNYKHENLTLYIPNNPTTENVNTQKDIITEKEKSIEPKKTIADVKSTPNKTLLTANQNNTITEPIVTNVKNQVQSAVEYRKSKDEIIKNTDLNKYQTNNDTTVQLALNAAQDAFRTNSTYPNMMYKNEIRSYTNEKERTKELNKFNTTFNEILNKLNNQG